MTIDAHQHFWRYDPSRDTWITDAMSHLKRDFLPEELEHERVTNGIDSTIVVQVDQSEDETLFLMDLAERYESISGVVGWVEFCSPKIEERLRFFSQYKKLCGFRHIAQAEPDQFLVGHEFTHGISLLREYGFAYDILIYPKQLAAPGNWWSLRH